MLYNSASETLTVLITSFQSPFLNAIWRGVFQYKTLSSTCSFSPKNKLAESLTRLIAAKDLYAGNVRAVPLNRIFKHGKIGLPSSGMEEIIDLLPKYPSGCSEQEQYRVQQFARNSMNITYMANDRYREKKWAKYFWQNNYNLVPCHPVSKSLEKGDQLDDEEMRYRYNTDINEWDLIRGTLFENDSSEPFYYRIKQGLFQSLTFNPTLLPLQKVTIDYTNIDADRDSIIVQDSVTMDY